MLDDFSIFVGHTPIEAVTEGLLCYLQRIFIEGLYLSKEEIHHLVHIFVVQNDFSIHFEFHQPKEVLNYVFVALKVKTFD